MNKFLFLMVAVLLLALASMALVVPRAQAATSDEITNYLNGEPALFCVAQDLGVPVEMVVAKKIKFDNAFGIAHGYAAGDPAWAESYVNRMQYFTGYLNTPNVLLDDGAPTQGCGRIIKAIQLLNALE